MRTWIAFGALLIGIVAMAARPVRPDTVVREHRVEVPVRIEVPVEVTKIVEKVRVETRTIEKESRACPAASKPSGTALAHEKMLFLFERELDLRAEQRRFMEDVLLEREKEIASYQKEVVASGIFRVKEYEYRVKAFQAVSYAKMGEALEGTQRQRLAALVAEGRLGDAVMFEVPPTLVVIHE
jgi:hypothetical protein